MPDAMFLVAVHQVTQHLQENIDEDFETAATNTNTQISALRAEMTDKTKSTKKNFFF